MFPETTPTAVHIYDFPPPTATFDPRLRSVLIHTRAVRHVRWNPERQGNLAICCGAPTLYTWSDEWFGENGTEEEIAECVGVPARESNHCSSMSAAHTSSTEKFDTHDIKWSSDGKGIILLDKDTFCCAFEVEDET